MATTPTGYTIIRTIAINNVGTQSITVNVKQKIGSLIFSGYGPITIKPKATLEAEDDRFDMTALISLSNKRTITYEKLNKRVDVNNPPGPLTTTGA
jgi:hypothetical protein